MDPRTPPDEVLPHPHVMLVDLSISGATAQYMLMPCQRSDPTTVTTKVSQLALRACVPNLHLPGGGPNTQMRTLCCPSKRGHVSSRQGK
eukprot:CAMPEP_0115609036 /NCGR_PEP_ID=MMETSP0272-20121206/19310_1 /TAXON_ID=71861 /ORGANISM="Scrippsiella trochoidea, Strain CCMP3099" /LENGTH=88 /DNA_ID=CAMNT_0003044725 /DNA_START=1083 /DNA_END=1349 /DNA_ORIENTATION=+